MRKSLEFSFKESAELVDSSKPFTKQIEELKAENAKLKKQNEFTKLFTNMTIHDLKHPISSF